MRHTDPLMASADGELTDEQARQAKSALAATEYEMLTDEQARQAKSALASITAILEDEGHPSNLEGAASCIDRLGLVPSVPLFTQREQDQDEEDEANEWVGRMIARSVALGQLPRQGDRPVREEEYADPEEYRPE